jgi:tape measure domain-containing protein
MADATLRIDADTRPAERALGGLQKSLSALATGAVTAAFVKFADQATELSNRLNQVSQSTEQTGILFSRLVGVANASRTPLTTTGDLFFRIARSAEALGISQNQALQATETVAKAISASGISAQEASGPLLQLGQALQSGRLQGDELRSILEGLPPVAKALADSLGVPIGELKRLGSEGKLSSQAVIQAILAARDTIERDFGKTTSTIAGQFTVLTNNFTVFVDRLNKSSGATTAIGRAFNYVISVINFLGDNIEAIITIIEILGTIFLAGKIIQGIKLAAGLIVKLGNQIKSVGYIFTDFAAGAAGVFKNIVAFWRSAATTLQRHADEFGSGFTYVWKAIYVYFGTVIKSIGSFFLNLAGPIAIATGYITGFFDRAIEGANTLLGKLPLIGRFFQKQAEATGQIYSQADVRRIDNAVEAMNKTTKAAEITSDAQRKFNEDVKKTIASLEQEYYVKLLGQTATEETVAIYKAYTDLVNKAAQEGAKLSAQQIRDVLTGAQRLAQLDAQIASEKKLQEIRMAARGSLETLRGEDPEYAAKVRQVEALLELEDVYQSGILESEAEYYRLRRQIDEQYLLDRYSAEESNQNRIDQLRAISLQKQLQAAGFSADQSKKISTERIEFEKKNDLEKAQWAIDQSANVFTELGKHNKAAFQAAKAFNIANAIMNTYMGATKALATYPPPFNFIGAAAVVAAGLAQVATIRSQQYSGRAVGGPVSGGQSYIVGEAGPEIFQPQGAGRIVPNSQIGGEPVNVTFNINTVDARGMDQLLMERKGMIVGMVRQAINDRGVKAPM